MLGNIFLGILTQEQADVILQKKDSSNISSDRDYELPVLKENDEGTYSASDSNGPSALIAVKKYQNIQNILWVLSVNSNRIWLNGNSKETKNSREANEMCMHEITKYMY